MKKAKKTRNIIYAFIDSQNLNLGVKSAGWTLDFAKFRVYLEEKYEVKKLTFLLVRLLVMKNYILICKN